METLAIKINRILMLFLKRPLFSHSSCFFLCRNEHDWTLLSSFNIFKRHFYAFFCAEKPGVAANLIRSTGHASNKGFGHSYAPLVFSSDLNFTSFVGQSLERRAGVAARRCTEFWQRGREIVKLQNGPGRLNELSRRRAMPVRCFKNVLITPPQVNTGSRKMDRKRCSVPINIPEVF